MPTSTPSSERGRAPNVRDRLLRSHIVTIAAYSLSKGRKDGLISKESSSSTAESKPLRNHLSFQLQGPLNTRHGGGHVRGHTTSFSRREAVTSTARAKLPVRTRRWTFARGLHADCPSKDFRVLRSTTSRRRSGSTASREKTTRSSASETGSNGEIRHGCGSLRVYEDPKTRVENCDGKERNPHRRLLLPSRRLSFPSPASVHPSVRRALSAAAAGERLQLGAIPSLDSARLAVQQLILQSPSPSPSPAPPARGRTNYPATLQLRLSFRINSEQLKADDDVSREEEAENRKKQSQEAEDDVVRQLEGIPLGPVESQGSKNVGITFVLEKASLEVAKVGKTYQILNSDDHANFLKRNGRNPAEYRPDIVHQALLSILDSPLNKAGKVRAVYVRTEKGVLFEVKPHVRIPRTYKRFSGIMLQLLQKLSITAAGQARIGFSHSSEKVVEMQDYVAAIGDDIPLVFVVGAMAHGKIESEYTDDFISISNYPLSAAFNSSHGTGTMGNYARLRSNIDGDFTKIQGVKTELKVLQRKRTCRERNYFDDVVTGDPPDSKV
ncbi:hypothetical protein NL676_019028 [Syzygium grande]|nr:hypothetical protein NL676_019028 [Syzygium grande]